MTAAVTVVIPTRNRPSMLKEALEGALGQEGVDVRVVVVDEASTEETAAYLAEVRDERVRILRHDVPKRLPGARNAGVLLAETEWVAFCDDDDIWSPWKLSAQLARLDRVSGAGWSCVGCVYVNEALGITGGHRAPPDGQVLAAVLANNVIPGGGSGVVARTDLVRRLGGFRALEGSEDWDLWIRLAREAPLAAVDEPLLAYRIHASSHSHDLTLMERADAELLARYEDDRRRLGVEPDWVEKQRYYARQEGHAGSGRAAATRLLRVARRTRSRGDAASAVLAAISPRLLLRFWQLRLTHHVDAEWLAQARPWLADVAARRPGPRA